MATARDRKDGPLEPVPGKLSLPRVRKVVLRNFTLFTLKREIEVRISEGVFCLAGANGLGKSTFLLALDFGITGIVPERPFTSVDKYYNDSMEFSGKFFAGRIAEADRETAEIDLELLVGDHVFELTRGMFESRELRSLTIRDGAGQVRGTADLSPGDRHRIYEEEITRCAGLKSFQQIVFLQHFVLTFDERRHLLFWDRRALEQTLYLAFGIDSSQAYEADALRLKLQKAESYARNCNWQAAELGKKIQSLKATSKGLEAKLEKLQEKYQEVENAVSKARDNEESGVEKLRDADLRLADVSARQASLQDEYARAFAKHIAGSADIAMHPVVVASKREGCCQLCGASGPEISHTIDGRIKKRECPLCGSTLGGKSLRSDIDRLRKLDKQLDAANRELTEVVKRKRRLAAELDEARHALAKAQTRLEKFTTENEKFIEQLRASASGGVRAVLREYTAQMKEFLRQKDEKYRERDQYQQKLESLRRSLQHRYASAEQRFVPEFKKLAVEFLGIDLDIRLDTAASAGVTLVLDIRGTARRERHNLSESQRYFVDIALRMALVRFMSCAASPGCLYIDTPEGSLDVAYETRAGWMFSQFSRDGFGIIMTANINGSRLLTAMAKRCGSRRMHVQRMTSWTELSEVQQQQEKLFAEAFSNIETALRSGGRRG